MTGGVHDVVPRPLKMEGDVAQQDVAQQDELAEQDAAHPTDGRARRASGVLSRLKGWPGVVLAVVVVLVVVVGGPALRSWWSGPTLQAATTWVVDPSDTTLDGTTLTLALDGTGRAEAFPMVGADDTCDPDNGAVYTGSVTWEKVGRGEIRVSGDGGRVSTIWTGSQFSAVDWTQSIHVGVCGRGTPSADVHVLPAS